MHSVPCVCHSWDSSALEINKITRPYREQHSTIQSPRSISPTSTPAPSCFMYKSPLHQDCAPWCWDTGGITSALLEKPFAFYTLVCSAVLPANGLEPESCSTKVELQTLPEPGCFCVHLCRYLSTAVQIQMPLQVTHESCVAPTPR